MKRLLLCAALALGLTTGIAHADVITTFDVSGTTDVLGNFTGTMNVDVTSGTMEAVSITVPTLATFSSLIDSFSPGAPYWNIDVGNTSGDVLTVAFTTAPAPGSLVGFEAGVIAFGTVIGPPPSYLFLGSITGGSITPAAVPEPSSLALLAGTIALLALAFVPLCRRRSPA